MLVWDREGISSFVLVPLEFGAGPTFSSSQCFQDSQQNRNLLRQNTSHLKHPRHIMVSCRSFRSWGHFSKKICCCWCHQSLHHETFHPPTPHLDLRIGHQVLLAKMQQPHTHGRDVGFPIRVLIKEPMGTLRRIAGVCEAPEFWYMDR